MPQSSLIPKLSPQSTIERETNEGCNDCCFRRHARRDARNGHRGPCDADMDAIKAAMGKTKLSEADAKIVSDVLAKAMDLDKAGKEEECEKSLHAAMKLVGVKEQHKK